MTFKSTITICCILVASPSIAGAFTISGAGDCTAPTATPNKKTYHYSFDQNQASNRNYKFHVSDKVKTPDVTIKSVSNPQDANLLLVEADDSPDMKVCKEGSSWPRHELVNVQMSDEESADIVVELSKDASDPQYYLDVNTPDYTDEEAAAQFLVVWQARRDKRKQRESEQLSLLHCKYVKHYKGLTKNRACITSTHVLARA